jgi:diaminohydroxyphosphoribosylaminopyrimidine deaminase/5-amino-6-(5-phosphoribosylamino)uracil reductase
VLDPRREVRHDARLFAEPGHVLVVTAQGDALEPPSGGAAAVELLAVPDGPGGLDLESVLVALAKRDVNELLVEAGPKLAGAFLAAGLADELVLYVAPHLLGDDALPLARMPRLDRIDRRTEFRIADVRQLGGDLRLTLLPVPRGGE